MKQPLRSKWEQWTGLTEYTDDYHITAQRKELFLTFLQRQPKQGKVLDIGCYQGDLVDKITSLGFKGYGVDILKKNIILAGRKYPQGTFRRADLNQDTLPFPSSFFDVIWAGDIIEHIYNTINLFSELNRVLKPGGYLICSTPYHGRLKLIAIALVDLQRHFHPEHPHVRFYTDRSLRTMLHKYGFSVKAEKYLGRIKTLSNNMFFISQKKQELAWEKIPKPFH